MGTRKPKQDLSTLPMWITKKNRNYYYNSKTGKYIHKSNITDHLPKEEQITPIQDWTKNYYGN